MSTLQPFEDAVNSTMRSSKSKWSISKLPCLLKCFLPVVALVFVATSLFIFAYAIAEFVFAVMGLAQSTDVINSTNLQANCLYDITTWFIVFGSFVVFL